MSDATDEYGCRPTDPDWMRQVAKDNNQRGVNVRWERTVKVHDDWYKPTPRVAESLDDLAVGMVVALVTESQTAIGTVAVPRRNQVHTEAMSPDGSYFSMMRYDAEHGRVFILKDADPPAPPAPEEACVCGHRKDEHGGGRCHHLNYGSGCEVHACSSCNGYTPASVPAPHAEAEADLEGAVQEWWSRFIGPTFSGTGMDAVNLRLAFEAGWEARGRGDRG